MYYAMRASAPSLHRESTDSLIRQKNLDITLIQVQIHLGMKHNKVAITVIKPQLTLPLCPSILSDVTVKR